MPATPHILLFLHDFPPKAGGGVMRWTKLTRYMQAWARSWTVVTAEPYREQLDPSLLEDLSPSVNILRVRDRRLQRWRDRLRRTPAVAPPEHASPGTRRDSGRLRSFYLAVRNNINLPDDYLGWALQAAWKARRLCRDPNTVVISSGPPHSAHLAAFLLSLGRNVTWIMDYRDGWAHNPLYRRTCRMCFHADRALERLCLRRCKKVVVDTEGKKEELTTWYGIAPHKIGVVANGYDPEDFPPRREKATTDLFHLTYTGNIQHRRTSKYLVEAILRLKQRHERFRKCFRLRLVGDASPEERALLAQLEDTFIDEGYRSHRDAMALLAQSDAAWLLEFPQGGGASLAPGKTYAYLGAGVFVFATIHDCHAAKVVREGPYGVVVAPDDVAAIAAALVELFEQWEAGGRRLPQPDDEGKYSRPHLAKVYLEIVRESMEQAG